MNISAITLECMLVCLLLKFSKPSVNFPKMSIFNFQNFVKMNRMFNKLSTR